MANSLSQWLPWSQSAEKLATERSRRRSTKLVPVCDGMEDRALLSHMGIGRGHGHGRAAVSAQVGKSSLATVAAQQVQTASATNSTTDPGKGFGPGGVQDTQLSTDLGKLRTDLNSIIGGSGVTDAQRQALRTDLFNVFKTGAKPDMAAFGTFANNLITSIADGSYNSKAASLQSDFNALFTGATVEQATLDQTFTDLVIVAKGLNIDSTELATLKSDQDAIQADFTRLNINPPDSTPDSTPKIDHAALDLILGGGGGHGPGFGGDHGHGRGPGRGFGPGRGPAFGPAGQF